MAFWHNNIQRLIDTHCHLLDYPGPQELLDKITQANLSLVAMSLNTEQFIQLQTLLASCPTIHAALGLFPNENVLNPNARKAFFSHLDQTRFIGEVGLDFVTTDQGERKIQCQFFEDLLTHCHGKNKIISVHSRRAAQDCLDRIGKNFQGKIIMHWFSGNPSLIAKSPDYIYFSVNTAMLKSKTGRIIIKAIPKHQLLLETDSPYIQATPFDLRIIVESLSHHWQQDLESVINQLEKNWQVVTA